MESNKLIITILKFRTWSEKNFLYILAVIFLLSFYNFFLFKEINLVTADLGRHIKNGELFFQTLEISKTNLYSYTYPEASFINHHWGTGTLFFLIWKIAGFSGLSFFFIAFSLLTFFLAFRLAQKTSDFWLVFPVALLAIPILAERSEIRPEVISYFLTILFFWIVWHWRNKKISFSWLWLLPFLEIIWINFHIYFFMGIFILGVFWLEEIIFIKKNSKNLTLILFFTVLASLINPFGIKAVIYPLLIFTNYGYQIVENKSIWFLENLKIFHSSFIFFKIASLILLISFVLAIIFNRKKIQLTMLIVSMVFLALACMAIRNFTLFGLFLIPTLSYNLFILREKINISNPTLKMGIITLTVIVFLGIYFKNSEELNGFGELSLGLMPNVNASADFFKKEKLQGPIFNNYDIGSYLIYHFYPQEKVFVDNRPEAYPVSFFRDVYIPMQEDDAEWQKQVKKYQFNSIFFYLNDYTPWSQKFLIDRIRDSEWAPVYVDQYAIIFLRRNDLNKDVISRFEIPNKNFSIKSN